MTPKQFLEKQDDGYVAGDYTPNEVYSLMEDYAKFKMIEENKSILAMAELHMDERAVLVLKQRIFDLERQS
ncbi:hypothetical protein [Flavobacterium sp.]|jgi:hypothetical protein|uniref:hypothetical protein n=1 Tax=Flavobacterium sp. TaxID=239 RepID=UPI0037C10ED0